MDKATASDQQGEHVSDVDELVRAETDQLAEVLDGLSDEQWEAASLCDGWRTRELVAHLLMPYELSVPSFLAKMVAARFSFDTVADRVATRDGRSNQDLVVALRATPDRKFNVPGAPKEAPLSHVVIHSEDVYRPLWDCGRREAPRLPTPRSSS